VRLGSLVAAAVETASRLLQALHRHKAAGTAAIRLRSGGVHSAAAAPAPALPLACTVGAAAALGAAKCLPYELPSTTDEPWDTDPVQPLLRSRAAAGSGGGAAQPEPCDMYGAAVRGNAAARPLLQYRTPHASGTSSTAALPVVSSAAAYIVTGGICRKAHSSLAPLSLPPKPLKSKSHQTLKGTQKPAA
jgi:hypothetical protein